MAIASLLNPAQPLGRTHKLTCLGFGFFAILGFWGFRFRVLGFRVLGFGALGLGALGFGFRVQGNSPGTSEISPYFHRRSGIP